MEEAIAAVATGPVRAAIGMVRLSGEGCVAAAERVFHPADGRPLSLHAPRTLVYGCLLDREGREIDRILATYAPAPHSFTGEDTAELHCHGSPTVLALAMEALAAQGVRPAVAGEFTRRAFLNGKLDLTQAEGVADLIDARTPAAVRAASRQLTGALSRRVEDLYQSLLALSAHFHATVDYPDEDLEPLDRAAVHAALADARGRLEALAQSYDRGRMLTQGAPCALVGRPNVGKSSLLNALLGYDRAIVTPLPGTTRDTVEELCQLGGVLLRLTDTAGLRDTADPVEQLGVERSRAALTDCQLALVVLDGSQPLTAEDKAVLALARSAPQGLCLLNKADLPPAPMPQDLPFPTLRLSAKTGQGLAELERAVRAALPSFEEGDAPLTNARQLAAVGEAGKALGRAQEALAAGLPLELPLTDVEAAMEALAALTGRALRADLVDQIFSRFCVGK